MLRKLHHWTDGEIAVDPPIGGDTLSNGWMVIEVTVRADRWTVLATHQTTLHPTHRWATWTMSPNKPWATEVGHHFTSLPEAVVDYLRRTVRLETLSCLTDEELTMLRELVTP